MEATGTGAGSGSFLHQYLSEKVSGSIPHVMETEVSTLLRRTTADLEISPRFAGPWRCDLSAESPLLNLFVHCAAPWMWERGGCRSTKRPFSCIDTGKQHLYSTSHKYLGPTALFWSVSIVPILLCAYSFFLRASACWGGVSGSLQINLNLK